MTAQFDHPGIMQVHELAAGEGGWPQTRVLGLLEKACEATSYAHAKGVTGGAVSSPTGGMPMEDPSEPRSPA